MKDRCVTSKVLYLSVDGLLDPLGESQILRYIIPAHINNIHFHVITFEKTQRLKGFRLKQIRESFDDIGYKWDYVEYKPGKSFFRKVIYLVKFYLLAKTVCKEAKFTHIQGRSLVPALVGLMLKFGEKSANHILDTRGSWLLERAERIRDEYYFFNWLPDSSAKLQYELYTRFNTVIFQTELELTAFEKYKRKKKFFPKSVLIRNSSDFNIFQTFEKTERDASRHFFGISEDDVCLGYVGSLGSWYLDERIFYTYTLLKRTKPQCSFKFLLVSPDKLEQCSGFTQEVLRTGREDIIYVSARTEDLPHVFNSIDYLVCFIRPEKSKLASSPTKFPEALACGTPILTNAGIGDFESLIPILDCGVVVKDLKDKTLNNLVSGVDILSLRERHALRQRCEPYFSAAIACRRYIEIYNSDI